MQKDTADPAKDAEKASDPEKDAQEASAPAKKADPAIRVVKVAAVAFGVLSWVATSNGLRSYVYSEEDTAWMAYFGSFAIQGLLIVFNLRLAEYITRFTKAKAKEGANFFERNAIKISAVFYVVVLFVSSTFAFVFIANFVYKDTRYFESHIALAAAYRLQTDKADEYVHASLLLTRQKISEATIALSGHIKGSGYQTVSEGEIPDIESLELAFANAQTSLEGVIDARDRNLEIDRDGDAGNDPPVGYQMRDAASVAAANVRLNEAESDLENAYAALPLGQSVNTVLSYSLKPDLDAELLNKSIERLVNAIERLGEGEEQVNASVFSDIVLEAQKLNIAAEELVVLAAADKSLGEISQKFEEIKDPPDPPKEKNADAEGVFDAELEAWKSSWKSRFSQLNSVIETLPSQEKSVIQKVWQFIEQIWDETSSEEILEDYDSAESIKKNNNVARFHLYDINPIERAVKSLGQKYNLLAFFSLFLAFFFDVASLLAGLFIWILKKEGAKGSQNAENVSQESVTGS